MSFDLVRLQAELAGEHLFGELLYRDHIDSTMELARERAEAGAPEGTLVIAGRQSAGRGRRGRGWESPPGGVWFSLLLRPPIAACKAGCLSVLLAVAAAQALRRCYGLPVRVKWPNDLLLERRKLAGVLSELATVDGQILWLVAGMGINVNNVLPEGARIPPISLTQVLGHPVRLESCLALVLGEIASYYQQFLREGFEPVRAHWSEFSALDDGVWVRQGAKNFAAQVKGLSEMGKLIVEHDGRLEELSAAEVALSPVG
ncbi:MAG TPA: biotin--[acetyl-CoA-carboxylase] ligase [Candidatus Fraserbacteria bacterium]|nr:biotin--[acetyl-CoA-carboxylase] ligase [Candidatus Fraserbacteria bacterium]